MNLIDSVIKKIIRKRDFNSTEEWNLDRNDKLYNIDFVEFECITEDMGGCQKEILTFRKSECQDIKEGYVFQH
ncbi:TPA: hypothetical protein PTV31_003137 [Clostridium botulinum]|nr:hypothetical protein [Clostridium botulinum]